MSEKKPERHKYTRKTKRVYRRVERCSCAEALSLRAALDCAVALSGEDWAGVRLGAIELNAALQALRRAVARRSDFSDPKVRARWTLSAWCRRPGNW